MIAAIAGRQHGVVTRPQLLAAGFSTAAIGRRIDAGRLHRVHAGVYLVGHTVPAPRSREMAALLACGPAAVLSHLTAASLWALLREDTGSDEVWITVTGRECPEREGLRVFGTARLDRHDVRRLDRLLLTSPARTLFDLASLISESSLERRVAEAQVRRLVRWTDLLDQLDRNRGRRGVARFRQVLMRVAGPALTRSEAERRFLRVVRAAGLPPPEVNMQVAGFEVDFVWRFAGLIVEVDGYEFHSDRLAFERDRLRDAELQACGFRVMRVTWRQLVDQPRAVTARIVRALRASTPF